MAFLPHFELPATLEDDSQGAGEYPFLLVTQSVITQSQSWNGIVPTLQECYGLQGHVKWSSWVEINPTSAEALHLNDGDMVWVESPLGRLKAPVRLYPGLWPNAIFLPYGQGHWTNVRWGRNSPEQMEVGVNPNQLLLSGSEPLNGQAITNPIRVKIYRA
jgi:anaerobic selenocysteine-containing dehydrogenase